ncbi:phenylalanine racemase [Listeria welshimeri]|uniref:phenylalanine racemase n=2 Tax=Listeria welshimeri TaxID=1643 RepID=UPI001888F564|nr:phenylalanine racemase [Listeria welshimeri]MBF2579793.1 phenylalanine racemase [Listeria welshimeri]MBF2581875.1 phenylalanine racemase [Listeria welshimeri]
MSKQEFNQLTELEKLFIMKEWENKIVFESTIVRNAVLNAEQNMNRKKNSRFIELHKKRQKKMDRNYTTNALQVILANEELEGKLWVDQIYNANGLRKPRKQ